MESTSFGNTPVAGPSKSIDSVLTKASSSAHAAVDSMAGAADEAARKAKPRIDQVAAMAHKAVDKAADAAAPTAEWLSDKSERLSATQQKVMSDTCSFVSANPLKSVGFAFLAGFLVSRIVR